MALTTAKTGRSRHGPRSGPWRGSVTADRAIAGRDRYRAGRCRRRRRRDLLAWRHQAFGKQIRHWLNRGGDRQAPARPRRRSHSCRTHTRVPRQPRAYPLARRIPRSAPPTEAPARSRSPRRTAVRAQVEVAVRDQFTAVRPPGGSGRQAAESSPSGLPGGTRDVGGDYIGGVSVQAAACPVIPHRGARICMPRRLLHVPQRHPGIQTGRERFTNHAE